MAKQITISTETYALLKQLQAIKKKNIEKTLRSIIEKEIKVCQ